MPRNGSGQYNPLTNTWNPPVTGVLATGADFQAQLNDISAAITQSVSKDGETPMTANLPMGNNSIAGIASGTVTTPSISANGDTHTGLYFPAADTVGVAVGGVNVGNFTSTGFSGNATNATNLVNGNATLAAGTAAAPSLTTTGDTNTGLYFPAADTVAIATGGTERARITSDGSLLVGTTSAIGSGKLSISYNAGVGPGLMIKPSSDTTFAVQFFNAAGASVGTIATFASSTSYNTSSDYRLKENIAPMTGALSKVAQLRPVTYKWNADGSDGEGFIAHELAEVVPGCVIGEKDATRIEQYEVSPAVPATYDEEGNELTPAVEAVMGEREAPVYQGIDTSFLVATLTAAIQEQQAIIESLKARLDAANL